MKLLTQAHIERLLANGKASLVAQQRGQEPPDHHPVVKLFMPEGAATWLLTEIDPDNPDIAFGLCDLGMGFPEIGSVSLAELQAVRGPVFRLPVERDLHFEADRPLSRYAEAAHAAGRITV